MIAQYDFSMVRPLHWESGASTWTFCQWKKWATYEAYYPLVELEERSNAPDNSHVNSTRWSVRFGCNEWRRSNAWSDWGILVKQTCNDYVIDDLVVWDCTVVKYGSETKECRWDEIIQRCVAYEYAWTVLRQLGVGVFWLRSWSAFAETSRPMLSVKVKGVS